MILKFHISNTIKSLCSYWCMTYKVLEFDPLNFLLKTPEPLTISPSLGQIFTLWCLLQTDALVICIWTGLCCVCWHRPGLVSVQRDREAGC